MKAKRPVKAASRSRNAAKTAEDMLRALRSAAKTARKIARMHGTPVYYLKDGKVVAEKP
jgi:hypothetical protein